MTWSKLLSSIGRCHPNEKSFTSTKGKLQKVRGNLFFFIFPQKENILQGCLCCLQIFQHLEYKGFTNQAQTSYQQSKQIQMPKMVEVNSRPPEEQCPVLSWNPTSFVPFQEPPAHVQNQHEKDKKKKMVVRESHQEPRYSFFQQKPQSGNKGRLHSSVGVADVVSIMKDAQTMPHTGRELDISQSDISDHSCWLLPSSF